ncbi:MAG: NHL repeat-containing protein [bacterium]
MKNPNNLTAFTSIRFGYFLCILLLTSGVLFAQDYPKKIVKYEILLGPGIKEADPHYIFTKPIKIRIDAKGNYYVLDIENNRVMKYDQELKFIEEYGRSGEFSYPVDIDVNLKGNLYVADLTGRRVTIFDENGKYSRMIALGQVFEDIHIAVDKRGYVFVTTTRTDSLITVYSEEGNELFSFGKPNYHENKGVRITWNVAFLKCDQNNNLWVGFKYKPLIRKYSNDGNLLFERKLDGPEIYETEKLEKPVDEKGRYRQWVYSYDFASDDGVSMYIGFKDYFYKLDPLSGLIVTHYKIEVKNYNKTFFLTSFSFDPMKKSFFGLSRSDAVLYRLIIPN